MCLCYLIFYRCWQNIIAKLSDWEAEERSRRSYQPGGRAWQTTQNLYNSSKR